MAKKVSTLVTPQLLKKKLSSWTLSAHVVETLGLSSDDEAQIKKELIDLCDKGIVEKDGVRRGLKFRYIGNDENEEIATEDSSDSDDTMHVAGDILAYVKQKQHDRDTLDVAGREFSDFLKYITLLCSPASDPSIISYTLAIKHTADGIVLRVHNGILLVYEKLYTVDKFLKYIAASGVQFNATNNVKSKPILERVTTPEDETAGILQGCAE